ncbi:MAG: hypothetical protein U1E69_14850 [Tabrizicola sp.]|uniref:hypothetical protein n=1 Tax=Tabrizicola sp. TaxID=2005166 RepID=UPI002ABCF3B5|nr:hypothetical protein [Tabrizicola sp.]MDZ4088066.1 hypothetical protein [Tabrizicola sp.]
MDVVVLPALAEPTRHETMRIPPGGSEYRFGKLTKLKQVLKHLGRVADRQDARLSRDRMNPAQSPMPRLVEPALDRGLVVTKAPS